MARFVLITGKIGSGKSKVAELLRKKHYIVIDSDSEVKKLAYNPEVYKTIVSWVGPKGLNKDGSFNKDYFRNELFFSEEPEKRELMKNITDLLVKELIEYLDARYEDSKEVIFVEAALTEQVGVSRSLLSINDVIFVHTKDELRLTRLKERPNYEATKQFEKFQFAKNLNKYNFFGMTMPLGPVRNFILLKNNGSETDLNDELMVLLEKKLNLTHEEKFATYVRYLKEAPTYCHDNAWCYSFFNLGGCVNCPFPCQSQDKYYQKLNQKFREEQKKKHSPETKYEEFIQAWADDYNQAQTEGKEFYVR